MGIATKEKGVHLTDEVFETVEVTAAKIKNRQTNTEAMLADIKAGRFRPDPNSVRCPRCPHFFVCDAVGRGPLSLI